MDKSLNFFAEEGEWMPANAPSVKGHDKIRERIEAVFNDPSFDWSVYSVKLAGIEISSSGERLVKLFFLVSADVSIF